jgi:hypothetical protein
MIEGENTASALIPILDFLSERRGLYTGSGTNFEAQPFRARLEITPRLDSLLVEVAFRAEDEDAAFHEELTWISTDLISDRVALWTVSSNMPGILAHHLSEDVPHPLGARRLVFRYNDPENLHAFRQEITIEFTSPSEVEYRYGWGVPHEKFATRTRSRLKRA